jgi:ATP-GRASP peptide maturase of grasp-with-spasm system
MPRWTKPLGYFFMILIFSESNDISTSQVMEWLLQAGKNVLRLNECDRLERFTLQKNSIELYFYQLSTSRHIAINLDDIETVWYRKGGLSFEQWLEQQFNNNYIDRYIQRELKVVTDYIYYVLSRKKMLATKFTSSMNKLHVNALAEALGLKTPDFIISTEKERLSRFLTEKKEDCITKAISETFYATIDQQFIISYTEPVSPADLPPYPNHIKPTLLQEKIDKKYELRIFYLDGVCYSSAIFSQNDSQTKVDFRKYNFVKPNRTIPYRLPEAVANQLHQLMQQLTLKTGSIDMLVTNNNEYIFLEVNPVGQFGMVSGPCNYPLEKNIAQFLAN